MSEDLTAAERLAHLLTQPTFGYAMRGRPGHFPTSVPQHSVNSAFCATVWNAALAGEEIDIDTLAVEHNLGERGTYWARFVYAQGRALAERMPTWELPADRLDPAAWTSVDFAALTRRTNRG